jgi:hypothetical protein
VVRNIPGIVITFAVGLAIVTFVVAAFGSGDDNALYRAYDVREVFAYQKEYLRAALLQARYFTCGSPSRRHCSWN